MTQSDSDDRRSADLWIFSPDETLGSKFKQQPKIVFNPQSLSNQRPQPKAVVLDGDGYATEPCAQQISQLKQSLPQVPVLVVSSRLNPETIFTLFKAGANGYLDKAESTQRLNQAIDEMQEGGAPISASIAGILIQATDLGADKPTTPSYDLEERDIQLLNFLSLGLTKKEIAERNGRSVHTIDNHFRRIYEKLGVNNLGGAIGKAFRSGVIK